MTREEIDEKEFEEWWATPHPEWKTTVYWKDRYICGRDAWFASRRLLREKEAKNQLILPDGCLPRPEK